MRNNDFMRLWSPWDILGSGPADLRPLLKSELEHEPYLGSRASLTHQKNGRKTQKAAESRRRWFYRVFICEICGQKLRFLKSADYGLLVLFECLTAGSYGRERVEFRLGSGDRASSAADSPVSAVPSPLIRSTLFAPRRSFCTAETTPARRENPAASLV